jgi:hypothetical protein
MFAIIITVYGKISNINKLTKKEVPLNIQVAPKEVKFVIDNNSVQTCSNNSKLDLKENLYSKQKNSMLDKVNKTEYGDYIDDTEEKNILLTCSFMYIIQVFLLCLF